MTKLQNSRTIYEHESQYLEHGGDADEERHGIVCQQVEDWQPTPQHSEADEGADHRPQEREQAPFDPTNATESVVHGVQERELEQET